MPAIVSVGSRTMLDDVLRDKVGGRMPILSTALGMFFGGLELENSSCEGVNCYTTNAASIYRVANYAKSGKIMPSQNNGVCQVKCVSF